jgi:hypothetical protein
LIASPENLIWGRASREITSVERVMPGAFGESPTELLPASELAKAAQIFRHIALGLLHEFGDRLVDYSGPVTRVS